MISKAERLFLSDLAKGVFSIDSEGRIWRHGRHIPWNRNTISWFHKTRRAEKPHKGYFRGIITIDGQRYWAQAHRLVWIFFNGEIPQDQEIHHKNELKTHNRPSNLELITHEQNVLISRRNHPSDRINLKLSPEKVKKIRRLSLAGVTQSEIAGRFGVSRSCIGKVVNVKTWIWL